MSDTLSNSPAAVRCDGMSKAFGALKAVNGVSFEIAPGSAVGIGGPNGAGKTTLFDLLTGIQSSTSGSIWIGDENLTSCRPDQFSHRGVARTFQLDVAFDTMTALENVRLAAYFGRRMRAFPALVYDNASYERAEAALDSVGLLHRAHDLMATLPVLDRKLVMLAGALVMQPSVLFMDEPVGGLTPPEIAIFEGILASVRSRGITLVIIKHVMGFLFRMTDRLLIMDQGKLIFDGPKEQMLQDTEVVEIYLGSKAAQVLKSDFMKLEPA
jgi:branched-chain amino acid transport system ATP-binding protein